MQPEVSDDRAQPLGIDVRVAGGCCDALMAQEPCTSRRLAPRAAQLMRVAITAASA